MKVSFPPARVVRYTAVAETVLIEDGRRGGEGKSSLHVGTYCRVVFISLRKQKPARLFDFAATSSEPHSPVRKGATVEWFANGWSRVRLYMCVCVGLFVFADGTSWKENRKIALSYGYATRQCSGQDGRHQTLCTHHIMLFMSSYTLGVNRNENCKRKRSDKKRTFPHDGVVIWEVLLVGQLISTHTEEWAWNLLAQWLKVGSELRSTHGRRWHVV